MEKALVLLLAFSLVSALFSALAPVSASALGLDPAEMPDESVYPTPEEQAYLYDALLNHPYEKVRPGFSKKTCEEYGVHFVEESIMRLYSVSLIEYAQTGVLELQPHCGTAVIEINGKSTSFDLPIYTVKILSSDGRFIGNYYFSITPDGKMLERTFSTTKEMSEIFDFDFADESCVAFEYSLDYRDHAAEIQELLHLDEPFPEEAVRTIQMDNSSYAYYINDGTYECLYYGPWCYYYLDLPDRPEWPPMRFVGMDELYSCAQHALESYKNWEIQAAEQKAEWDQEEHLPGEYFVLLGIPVAVDIPSYYETNKTPTAEELQGMIAIKNQNHPVTITSVMNEQSSPEPTDPATPTDPVTPAGPASVAFFNWQTGVALGAVAILVSAAILALSRTRNKEDP